MQKKFFMKRKNIEIDTSIDDIVFFVKDNMIYCGKVNEIRIIIDKHGDEKVSVNLILMYPGNGGVPYTIDEGCLVSSLPEAIEELTKQYERKLKEIGIIYDSDNVSQVK